MQRKKENKIQAGELIPESVLEIGVYATADVEVFDGMLMLSPKMLLTSSPPRTARMERRVSLSC